MKRLYILSTLFSTLLLFPYWASGQWNDLTDSTTSTTRRVGLNVNTPGGLIHLKGTGQLNGWPGIYLQNFNSSEGDITWSASNAFQLGIWSPLLRQFTERMSIRSNGKVSIKKELFFDDNNGDKLSLFGDRLGQTGMFGMGVESGTLYYKADGQHRWYVSSNADGGASDLMQLNANRLDLNVPITMEPETGDQISLFGNRLGQVNMYGFGVEDGTLYFKSASNYRWYSGDNADGGNSAAMVLNANGNVGIGTGNPDNSFRLSVNGSIRAKEIVVETNWSDFVFEKDYYLRPLSEVRNYIEKNGHLPEIPSAKDVEQNGVKVGEMESKLLMKVEELTLYMIQMEEKMQVLQKKNRDLEEQIQSLK